MTFHGGLLSALGPLLWGSYWMWVWALAAAAPILIHLWSRRRYQEMAWAAMEYLLAAVRKNSRRIRIEQLLLLAIRALIILLAAAAWMDLSWSLLSRPGSGLTGSLPTHTVLVIDGSYSMAFQGSDKTLFERAKDLSLELVDNANQGDAFTLVLMADPPRVVIAQPAFDPADVKEEITGLTLPHGGADLVATLAEVESILQSARQKHQRLGASKVCFLTDLGRTTWEAASSSDNAERFQRLARDAYLQLVDLGQSPAENLAVTQLEVVEPYATIAREVTLRAHVRNFGRQDVTSRQVDLLVDGQPARQETVDVPAGGETTVAWVHRFELPGEHAVSVRLAPDRLEVDDHRWLSLPVRESLQVLLVNGRQGAARYVQYALSPAHDDRPQIRAEQVSESAILERDLSTYDCVFLCNVGRFSREEAGVLSDYLQSGGGLVFFLGDQVVPESYNRELVENVAAHVLPARIGPAVSEAQYHFDPRDYTHPIVAPFRGHERTGLLTTPIWKYFKLQPLDSAKTALWFENGDPAIVEEPIGGGQNSSPLDQSRGRLRGRSILVATAASGDSLDRSGAAPIPWTLMSSWHSFPPLVQEMLSLAVAGRYAGRNVLVGDELMLQVSLAALAAPLEIENPSGGRERVRATVTGGVNGWIFSATDQSGIYQAQFGKPDQSPTLFAVNVDTRESDLSRVDPEQLPSKLRRDIPAPDESHPALSAAGSPRALYRYFLLAVLGLLLVETVLAYRFGNSAA